jgi:hypothetical protein
MSVKTYREFVAPYNSRILKAFGGGCVHYFDEMLTTLSYRGLVVCSQYSPVVELLKGGKYDAVQRDLRSGRRAIFEYLQNWFAQR